MKIDKIFQLKIVIFTPVKNRCILHGHVFVMNYRSSIRFQIVLNQLLNSHYYWVYFFLLVSAI